MRKDYKDMMLRLLRATSEHMLEVLENVLKNKPGWMITYA